MQQGDQFAAQGKLEPAIEEYEKAMAAGAGSAAFLNRLGEMYLFAQKPDRALAVFQRSLREKPGQLPVYSKLGEIFVAAGRLDSGYAPGPPDHLRDPAREGSSRRPRRESRPAEGAERNSA